jgi:hypothetical protein
MVATIGFAAGFMPSTMVKTAARVDGEIEK